MRALEAARSIDIRCWRILQREGACRDGEALGQDLDDGALGYTLRGDPVVAGEGCAPLQSEAVEPGDVAYVGGGQALPSVADPAHVAVGRRARRWPLGGRHRIRPCTASVAAPLCGLGTTVPNHFSTVLHQRGDADWTVGGVPILRVPPPSA